VSKKKSLACPIFYISAILLFQLIQVFSCFAGNSSEVKIKGHKGDWGLLVNKEPFYIKGAGCGLAIGKNGEDYLKLARDLGANCVRTWGIDQGNKDYLDRARGYGLMVDAGIWINWADPSAGISYLGENKYKKDKWEEVLSYVREFKDHPVILMWNVGNEAIFFTRSEKEKVALCGFLEGLIKEIHRIDPNHPVIYASAGYLDLPYLKKYVPSLDIIGMNAYGSIRLFHSYWDFMGFDKPYVLTEYGHYLPCDRARDINAKAEELGDYQKALIYKDYTQQILSFKGGNLGGFVFHLGDTTQESLTWWNINQGELKRQAYWKVYEIYTGKPAPYSAPKIKKFVLSKVKDLKPGEMITAEATVEEKDGYSYSYEYLASTSEEGVLQYYVNKPVAIKVTGEGSKVKIEAPDKEGVYRLYCFVKDKDNNLSSLNKSIQVGR
jgi:hypothetical protein